jgi:hypothetical protein
MTLAKILDEFRREKKLIDEAILALERLLAGSGPRRGRPPNWLKGRKPRGRPPKKPPTTAGLALRLDAQDYVVTADLGV